MSPNLILKRNTEEQIHLYNHQEHQSYKTGEMEQTNFFQH